MSRHRPITAQERYAAIRALQQLDEQRHEEELNVNPITCKNCGGHTEAASRCTNGHCYNCHQWCCTPGGATSPGHNLRVFAVESAGRRVLVQAQQLGFYNCSPAVWSRLHVQQSPAETEAALNGSMFGWNCPAADPLNYHADGSPIKKGAFRHG